MTRWRCATVFGESGGAVEEIQSSERIWTAELAVALARASLAREGRTGGGGVFEVLGREPTGGRERERERETDRCQ
ncbi:hypothetical protein M6B38_270890 [Iris pallida]|uniref:Uncharacterized protein n=1 Tax=Iris pallida TaxID=29817 RepID=A0AAX6I7F8_IRIPA|nr:hypothetical protein M6B38_270890 [Iris pallida]